MLLDIFGRLHIRAVFHIEIRIIPIFFVFVFVLFLFFVCIKVKFVRNFVYLVVICEMFQNNFFIPLTIRVRLDKNRFCAYCIALYAVSDCPRFTF